MGLRKGESQKVIMVGDRGKKFKETKLMKVGESLIDHMNGRTFMKLTKTVNWNGENIPLVSEDKGVSVEPEIDGDILKLKTNPSLLNVILEPQIIQNAFKIKPDMKKVLIAFVFGFILGGLFLAPGLAG